MAKLQTNNIRLRRFKDLKNLKLLQRTEVVENLEFTKAYPRNGIINKVNAKLKDGIVLSEQVDFPKVASEESYDRRRGGSEV
jgi:2-methylcitrate dehydratase PrpD